MTAAEQMVVALTELTYHEQVPPCGHDPEAWVSEDREERAEAARRCNGCPLLAICQEYAREIHANFGVFGAHDFTPRPTKARTR